MEAILLTILYIALVGFLVYVIIMYIPMPDLFKQVITVGVAVLVILWLIALIFGHAPSPQFPMLR